MPILSKQEMRQALISILIGAMVAFLTALLQGALDALRGADFVTGPIAGAGWYLAKAYRFTKIV